MSATLQLEGPLSVANPGRTPARQLQPPHTAEIPVARPWIRTQAINSVRHAAYLRPFRKGEFGEGGASPTEGHRVAANRLIANLRRRLLKLTGVVSSEADAAGAGMEPSRLERLVVQKDRAHRAVQEIEKVWEFYHDIFGERQTQFGDWLVSCDRIALDCYQDAFTGLGIAKSIPAPPPFSHMRSELTPATFRRGIFLRRLGQVNPFPLIELPYRRLLNPWTLGAILHEVSHNLQNELGLAKAIPQSIMKNMIDAGLGRKVAATWRRWNRESFADLNGLLLGGPAVVGSLMDVIGRAPEVVLTYRPRGVHPTPYLRLFLSAELLRRMGFRRLAERFAAFWSRIYPDPAAGAIPTELVRTFPKAVAIMVDTICFQPYQALGNKSLAGVIRFGPKEQQMIEEAARRLASGTDPGIIPERYMIGAARYALERKLARPEAITRNFYKDLARR